MFSCGAAGIDDPYEEPTAAELVLDARDEQVGWCDCRPSLWASVALGKPNEQPAGWSCLHGRRWGGWEGVAGRQAGMGEGFVELWPRELALNKRAR